MSWDRPRHYILIGQTAVPINAGVTSVNALHNLRIWGKCFESDDRKVASSGFFGIVSVETDFLGIDHSWGDGPPRLFESMAFWWGEGEECLRCATWLEAEEMHREMCAEVVKPRAVWEAVGRLWRKTWDAMLFDFRRVCIDDEETEAESEISLGEQLEH